MTKLKTVIKYFIKEGEIKIMPKLKKILLVGYHFFPEQVPRSFRMYELARELSKTYKVTLIIPKLEGFDIEKIGENISVISLKSGYIFNRKKKINLNSNTKLKKKSYFKSKLRRIFNYFFDNRQIEYSLRIYRYLKNNVESFDCVISIALPFCTHLGCYLGMKNDNKKLILDYGDPFYFNTTSKKAFYFRNLEKKILKRATYIALPIEEAKKAFSYYQIENKINIIPQGFALENIKLAKYKKNEIPNFCYAGIFYSDIRNPLNFFKKLNLINREFKLVIYTNIVNYNTLENITEIEKERKKLGKKVQIKNLISREECIYEMSKMDFLINLENINKEQSPSKLIDYAISKRPILSFNQNNFDISTFEKFLDGDYSKEKKIDVEKYNIKNIAHSFIELIEK